jgi:hypothetical protein
VNIWSSQIIVHTKPACTLSSSCSQNPPLCSKVPYDNQQLCITHFPLNYTMYRYFLFNQDEFWFCEAVNRAPCTFLYRLFFDSESPFRDVLVLVLSLFLISTLSLFLISINYLHMIIDPIFPSLREDNEEDKDICIRKKMAYEKRFEFVPWKDVQQDKRSFDCCPICLRNFELEEEVVRSTSCKHVFHQDCLVMWLHRGSPSCPCCREVLLSQ